MLLRKYPRYDVRFVFCCRRCWFYYVRSAGRRGGSLGVGGERETTGLVTGERRSHEHRAIQKDIQALWRLRPTKSLITAVSASEANKAWRCGRQRERAEPLTALMIYLMIAVSERTRKKLLVRALASYVLYHVAPILKAGKKITEKQKKIVPKS